MASRGDISKDQIQPVLFTGWSLLRFDETLDKIGTFVKLKTRALSEEGDYPVIDQGERLISGYINDDKLLYQGNLPVIIFGDHTRNIKYIDFDFAVGADGTKILKPFEFYDPKFFYYYLRSLRIPSLGYSRHYSILRELDVPLAPLIEQQQIALKLNAIFNHLDSVNKRLGHIPELIKAFKERVLTKAITGKLTEEWRTKRKIQNAWKKELAANCCEKVQSGGTPKQNGFTTSGHPFLKVYNIVNQKIDFEYRPQFVSTEAHNKALKKSICYPGDVLMNIVGPPLCKIAIVPETYNEWNLNQAITLFRPKKYLNNKFLFYFFCEGTSVKEVMPETKGVVGQINISLSQCRAFEIPIPTMVEQQEIVRRVEELFALADKMESGYKLLKGKIDSLPLLILAKAFKGELVDQDNNDKPKEQLSKRDSNTKTV